MKLLRYFSFMLLLPALQLNAQSLSQPCSSHILHGLQKLNTVGSVLYIAAHPDDENTRLLAYLANERKLRTGYLSLTRGDGGQNLIGKEQGELLGLVRTQELLAARRTDGAEQFFTRANDFGFSKNPEETFSIWNKDSILADVVLAIRRFKPDVIICRFPTTGEGGHGHHTASAILALEAFDAAADPRRFPEQLAYTEVWQSRRIFWNTFNFGTTNTTSPEQVQVDVGMFNPLLGQSYGEIAADSRSMHKSQGFGSAKTRGQSIEFFKQLKGDSSRKDVFENMNTGWSRFAQTAAFETAINDIIKNFNALAPEKSLPALIAFYRQLQNADKNTPETRYWCGQKLKETEALILACSGFWAEVSTADYLGIPGNTVNMTVQALNRNNSTAVLNSIHYPDQSDSATALSMKVNELYTFKHKAVLPASMPYSNPYWLNEPHDIGLYTVRNPALIGKPENDAAESVVFDINILDLNLKIRRGLIYKYTDPVKGEVYRPFEVLPPVTVNISEKVYVYSSVSPKSVQFVVKANAANVSGKLQVQVPAGWTVNIKNPAFTLVNKGDEALIEAMVSPGKSAVNGRLSAAVEFNGKQYSKSIKRIEYDHIPYQFTLSDAEANLVTLDLKTSGTNIAYIPGAGDDVAACLKQLGYNVSILTDEMLGNANLQQYDAIVAGIRAYNTNDRLQVYYSKLMDYVNKGGNLVVQYNTNNRIGPLLAKIGPYPFTISRDRVTDEKAEVRFTNPKHPALNFPNVITAADFDNWIQERGIYFATESDKQYESILSLNDPGETAKDGSLIIAKYGKGNFVYTGLVFFRELPAGIPGAYRLFVNLLSLPKNK